MPTISSHRPKLRLGVVVGDDTWRFFKDIYRYLRHYSCATVFEPHGGFDLQNRSLTKQLRAFMKIQDVTFFEWSNQMLALATEQPARSKIVTRLHRYELFKWAEVIDWSRVDAAIFVNSVLLKKFQTYWKAQPRKAVVIPPAISTRRFHPIDFGLTYRIGTLCWLTPRKRVYELILAFSEICRRAPRLRLSIAGGRQAPHSDYYDAMLALVDRLGLQDRIQFVGEPKHAPAWYRTLDVFISNSFSEGVQVSLLEAMSSACYCLSHIWQGAENILPPEQLYSSDGELQQKLLDFYATPWRTRHRVQQQMREEACRRYDIKIVQRQILSLVQEVARS